MQLNTRQLVKFEDFSKGKLLFRVALCMFFTLAVNTAALLEADLNVVVLDLRYLDPMKHVIVDPPDLIFVLCGGIFCCNIFVLQMALIYVWKYKNKTNI